jgi:hypothetical protein
LLRRAAPLVVPCRDGFAVSAIATKEAYAPVGATVRPRSREPYTVLRHDASVHSQTVGTHGRPEPVFAERWLAGHLYMSWQKLHDGGAGRRGQLDCAGRGPGAAPGLPLTRSDP